MARRSVRSYPNWATTTLRSNQSARSSIGKIERQARKRRKISTDAAHIGEALHDSDDGEHQQDNDSLDEAPQDSDDSEHQQDSEQEGSEVEEHQFVGARCPVCNIDLGRQVPKAIDFRRDFTLKGLRNTPGLPRDRKMLKAVVRAVTNSVRAHVSTYHNHQQIWNAAPKEQTKAAKDGASLVTERNVMCWLFRTAVLKVPFDDDVRDNMTVDEKVDAVKNLFHRRFEQTKECKLAYFYRNKTFLESWGDRAASRERLRQWVNQQREFLKSSFDEAMISKKSEIRKAFSEFSYAQLRNYCNNYFVFYPAMMAYTPLFGILEANDEDYQGVYDCEN